MPERGKSDGVATKPFSITAEKQQLFGQIKSELVGALGRSRRPCSSERLIEEVATKGPFERGEINSVLLQALSDGVVIISKGAKIDLDRRKSTGEKSGQVVQPIVNAGLTNAIREGS